MQAILLGCYGTLGQLISSQTTIPFSVFLSSEAPSEASRVALPSGLRSANGLVFEEMATCSRGTCSRMDLLTV